MQLGVAEKLVNELLAVHGLAQIGWKFSWIKHKRLFGRCVYTSKEIQLSWPQTKENNYDHVKDTIIHEICHALVGPGHGHGPVFKQKASEIGCTGTSTKQYSVNDDGSIGGATPAWVLLCREEIISKYYCKPKRAGQKGLTYKGTPLEIISYTEFKARQASKNTAKNTVDTPRAFSLSIG